MYMDTWILSVETITVGALWLSGCGAACWRTMRHTCIYIYMYVYIYTHIHICCMRSLLDGLLAIVSCVCVRLCIELVCQKNVTGLYNIYHVRTHTHIDSCTYLVSEASALLGLLAGVAVELVHVE